MPLSRKRGSSRRISVGRLVVVSTHTHPVRMLSSRPPGPVATASTSDGPGSDVSVTSARRASSATDPAARAPRAARSRTTSAQIVDHQRVARLHQVPRHAAAHVAQADQSDGVHAASCGCGHDKVRAVCSRYPGRLRLTTGRPVLDSQDASVEWPVEDDVYGVDTHHLDPQSPGRRAGVGEPERGQRDPPGPLPPTGIPIPVPTEYCLHCPSPCADSEPDQETPEERAGKSTSASGEISTSPLPHEHRQLHAIPRSRSRRGAGPPSRGVPGDGRADRLALGRYRSGPAHPASIDNGPDHARRRHRTATPAVRASRGGTARAGSAPAF